MSASNYMWKQSLFVVQKTIGIDCVRLKDDQSFFNIFIRLQVFNLFIVHKAAMSSIVIVL